MTDFDKIENAYVQNSYATEKTDIIALIEALEDKNITDREQNNLYHLAAKYADYDTIKYLGEAKVKPRANDYDVTPLHILAKNFSTEEFDKRYDDIYNTAKLLLELGVNAKKKNSDGVIAYCEAGERAMFPFIAAMVDNGIKLDAVYDEQKNLLHKICSDFGNRKTIPGILEPTLKTVKIIVDGESIDLEEKDLFKNTPLDYAQKSGSKELMAILLPDDDSVLKTGGMTLHEAVVKRDYEAIDALIKEGQNVNEVSDKHKKTPLMLACEFPDFEIIKLLLNNGANPNLKTGDSEYTPIYYLLKLGKGNFKGTNVNPKIELKKVIRLLVDNGLNLDDTIDSDLNTALIYIVANYEFSKIMNSLAEDLIDEGCDINVCNKEGQTALMRFAAVGNEQEDNIAELLLDNDADCSISDKFSYTALMYAAENDNHMSGKKIIELIVEKDNRSINNSNNAGETALDIAVNKGNESIVKVLLENM